MANETFKIDDVAYVISGSPKLKVVAVDGDEIMCQWKNPRTKETVQWSFERYTLTKDATAHEPSKMFPFEFKAS